MRGFIKAIIYFLFLISMWVSQPLASIHTAKALFIVKIAFVVAIAELLSNIAPIIKAIGIGLGVLLDLILP